MGGVRGEMGYLSRGVRVVMGGVLRCGTEPTETRLGTWQRGLGSYKFWRAVRPLNVPELMEVIRLRFKYLLKRSMSKRGDTRMMRWDKV